MADPARVSHTRLSTQFGLLDVAVRQRPEGDWYACLDTSHPQLRHLPGFVGPSHEQAVAGLLTAVGLAERGDWALPLAGSDDCSSCEPAVRVRVALASQTVVGFAVAQTASQVWVVWEHERHTTTSTAWVPVAAVSQLATGRRWLLRHRHATSPAQASA